MILKASQRGGAKALADHLMNEHDNDHITCLELRDFASDDLHGALAEMHAISKATQCQKFMFSLSLNPPQDHIAMEQKFLDAADRVEQSLGLEGQPRAIVTHEKEGRRHAHVVWSRIGVENLKAIHMGRYKLALRDLSRDLFLDHGWELPDGLATYGNKNPLNFTLEEWQQAKHKGLDPREIKQVFQRVWARCDTQQGFRSALEEHGYFLARGDRRGFVALDIDGKPHSVAKWTGLKAREVKAKLGAPEDLPSVSEARSAIHTKVTTQMRGYIVQVKEQQAQDMEPLKDAHTELKQSHREERQRLQAGQEKRWVQETRMRSDRLNTGLRGIFDRLTGTHQAIRKATTVDLVNRIFLSEVCAASYNQINEGNAEQVQILQKYGNRSGPADFSQAANMIALAQMFEDDAVIITWDRHAAGADIDEHTCGYVRVNLTEFDEAVDASDSGFAGGNIRSALLEIHQGVKAQYVRQIGAIAEAVRPSAQAIARNRIEINKKPEFGQDAPLASIPDDIREITNDAARALSTTLELSYDQMTGATFGNKDTMVQQGWGAAGMWFSNIAKINQQYMEAISAGVPVFGNVADVAEGESRERSGFMRWFGVGNMGLDSGTAEKIEETIRFASDTYGEHIQQDSLYGNTKFTLPDDDLYADGSQMVADAVVGIFGGGPLRDLQQNPTLDPMAKLTQGGHHMITGSFIMFGVGALAGTLSLLPGVFSKIPMIGGFFEEASGVLKGAMSILFAIGVIGLLAGCMLAYVLPLIPFIYFTFAVLGWVLEIFEAIAAMPLWALAHLRIDGDGIAGPAALGGYQLLLMILIRPALIVIGLIGGSVIFGASMFYLSSLFDSAVSISRDELTGGTTGPVGLIVYTVIFVFLAYNIALMCFKLIDDVPKGMLRWLGAGISPFSDSRADPIGGQQALMIGALGAGSQLISGGRSGLQSSQKGFERGRMRRQGMDPDNPIQSVRIAGDAAGSPGGGGAPDGGPLAGMGAKGQEFVNRNPKGPSSSLADRPSDTDPKDGD